MVFRKFGRRKQCVAAKWSQKSHCNAYNFASSLTVPTFSFGAYFFSTLSL
jgi:hypothetical protein